MKKLKRAKTLDQILLKFRGNITVKWSDLQAGNWNDVAPYYVCENYINYLISDNMLRRDTALNSLSLTEKGLATMTDLRSLGYVKKSREEFLNDTVRYFTALLAAATFCILVYNNFIVTKTAPDVPKSSPGFESKGTLTLFDSLSLNSDCIEEKE